MQGPLSSSMFGLNKVAGVSTTAEPMFWTRLPNRAVVSYTSNTTHSHSHSILSPMLRPTYEVSSGRFR